MLTAILTASLATVDYSCRAQRMELVVPELERVTSLDLAVSQELRDEVVVIDVRNVETEALLEKIAFVLRADWHERNGVPTLERDAARRTKNEKEDEATLKKQLIEDFYAAFPLATQPIPQQALDQFAADLALINKIDPTRMDEARNEWYGFDPLVRSVPMFLEVIDWSVVRRSFGAQAVFASHPIGFESLLPKPTASAIFASMARDVAAIEAVCKKRGVAVGADWATAEWEKVAKIASTDQPRVFFRTALPYSSVGITVEDASGTLLASQGTGSRGGTPKYDPKALGFDPLQIKDGPYFSDRSKRFAAYVRSFRTEQPDATIRFELADVLTHDPRSYADTDFVKSLGSQLRSNTVAAFSDLERTVDYLRGKLDGSIVETLSNFLGLHQAQLTDGWLTARPKTLVAHEFSRLDRRAFAGVLASLKANDSYRIQDYVLAVSPMPSFFFYLCDPYMRAASARLTIDEEWDGQPLNMGEFYRALTPAERDRVERQTVPVRQLSARAMDVFRFSSWPIAENQVTHDPDNPRPYQGWSRAMSSPPADLVVQLKLEAVPGDATRAVFYFTSGTFPKRGEVGFSHPTGTKPSTL